MADFLDRYGDQLRLARARERRRSRAPRRAAIASLLILAVAAPAVAVVQPWNPELGHPMLDDHTAIDRSPVDRSAAEVLAILRRPQTVRDREIATPLLRYAVGPIDNVQVDSIRALGKHHALVPHTSHDNPGKRSGAMLCILGDGGASCSPVSGVAGHGVIDVSDGPKVTKYVGVVPDGVTRVRFTPDSGKPVRSSVRDNFFVLRVRRKRRGTINEPVPPTTGRLEWLDAEGKVVGPAERRN